MPCQKAYARTSKQRMGELPVARVNLPGPFLLRGLISLDLSPTTKAQRKPTVMKGYVCVYVCFATKAVFIDLVADLHLWHHFDDSQPSMVLPLKFIATMVQILLELTLSSNVFLSFYNRMRHKKFSITGPLTKESVGIFPKSCTSFWQLVGIGCQSHEDDSEEGCG